MYVTSRTKAIYKDLVGRCTCAHAAIKMAGAFLIFFLLFVAFRCYICFYCFGIHSDRHEITISVIWTLEFLEFHNCTALLEWRLFWVVFNEMIERSSQLRLNPNSCMQLFSHGTSRNNYLDWRFIPRRSMRQVPNGTDVILNTIFITFLKRILE